MDVLMFSCPQKASLTQRGNRRRASLSRCRPGWSAVARALLLAGSLLLFAANAQAVPELPSEYQIKAAMVFTMAKFVEWPAAGLGGEGAPLNLCVLGKGPFGQAVEGLKGKSIKGHPITVRPISRVGEIGNCQILVVNDSERRQVQGVVEKAGQGVLTISDMRRFAQAGGMIGFVVQEGKVRFEINLESAQKSGVVISSQVLKLATIVREGK